MYFYVFSSQLYFTITTNLRTVTDTYFLVYLITTDLHAVTGTYFLVHLKILTKTCHEKAK